MKPFKRSNIVLLFAIFVVLISLACNELSSLNPQYSVPEIEWAVGDESIEQPLLLDSIFVEKYSLSDEKIDHILNTLVGDGYCLCTNYVPSQADWEAYIQRIIDSKIGIVSDDYVASLRNEALHAGKEATFDSISIKDLPLLQSSDITILKQDHTVSFANINRGGNSFVYSRAKNLAVFGKDLCEFYLIHGDENEKKQFQQLMPNPSKESEQQYREVADTILDELGLRLHLFYSQPCRIITDYSIETDGWQFIYTLDNQGFFSQFWDGQWYYINPDYPPVAASPWGIEYCSIFVDQNGLCYLVLNGSSIEVSRSNPSQIKSISKIKADVIIQLQKMYQHASYSDNTWLQIKVTDAVFGIALISDESQNKGVYVPAWYITYRYKWNTEEDSPESWEQEQIIFNAIDATYIEPRVTKDKLLSIISHD